MKIEKKLDEETLRFLREFVSPIGRHLDELRAAVAQAVQHRADGTFFALKGLGYERDFERGLSLNLQDGTASWDDGKEDVELAKKKALEAAEKRKAAKLIEETAKALAEKKPDAIVGEVQAGGLKVLEGANGKA